MHKRMCDTYNDRNREIVQQLMTRNSKYKESTNDRGRQSNAPQDDKIKTNAPQDEEQCTK